MAKQSTNVYIELPTALATQVKADYTTIEVEFEVDYWIYSQDELEVEEVRLTRFLDNGTAIDAIISNELKDTILKLVNVTDSDFIAGLFDSYYCGLDY
jgi:hypothetical protein